MNKVFAFLKLTGKPVYIVFISVSLFFFISSSSGQKKSTSKATTNKSSTKRVIYGLASFYANKFNGRKTANGEIFSQSKLTCACNMLPLGTWVKVTNVRNGKSVIVKVNDRLHPKMRRVADLSRAAATKLGYTAQGLVRVKVEVLGKKKRLN
jgi:rare lipoprotein A